MIQGLAAVEKAGSAASAFGNMAGTATASLGNAVETSFAEALSSASTRAVDVLEGAQGLSLQALQGDVETREVVDAVMNAEQTLQAAIAIRDKIVTAYLEVSRMAI